VSCSRPPAGTTVNTALASGAATDGSVATDAGVAGQSGSTLAAGATQGTASGADAASTSALTALTTPTAGTAGGFTAAQGFAPAGQPATSSSLTTLLAGALDKLATAQLASSAAAVQGGGTLANTGGVAAADPSGAQLRVGCGLQAAFARSPTPSPLLTLLPFPHFCCRRLAAPPA
jgi:hypothetical protein